MAVQLFNNIKQKEKKKTKNMKKHVFVVFHGCYVEIHLFLVNLFIFLYVLDIDVTRNGNNSKLKVKSEFSLIKLSMGLMLINPIYTVLPYCVISVCANTPT